MSNYAIGYDIGSSSVKGALFDLSGNNKPISMQYPPIEMPMYSMNMGWAEQDPETWWECVCQITPLLLAKAGVSKDDIKSIGISYQMHGLVIVDKNHQVIRPSIIWCDSRANEIGQCAYKSLGKEYCSEHLLNSPGNFTASKLRWVRENEPYNYEKIFKMMLPGDFIAMKMSGIINTTISGLSEAILWDFKNKTLAHKMLDIYDISEDLIPELVPNIGFQCKLSEEGATSLGLNQSTPITYRGGDQPNNAMSLGVLAPGKIAATGGTSGVVYGITDQLECDKESRINSFAHINHDHNNNRIGQLLCINGAGSQYSWMRKTAAPGISYTDMETRMSNIPIGSDNLQIFPFGNGSERMLLNKIVGAQIKNIEFNVHTQAHMWRASLEGIAFAFVYGIHILKELGVDTHTICVGNDNLFQSPIFANTIVNTLQCDIKMYDTTGAVGAAKASAVAIGHFSTIEQAIGTNQLVKLYEPNHSQYDQYTHFYQNWKKQLINLLVTI